MKKKKVYVIMVVHENGEVFACQDGLLLTKKSADMEWKIWSDLIHPSRVGLHYVMECIECTYAEYLEIEAWYESFHGSRHRKIVKPW